MAFVLRESQGGGYVLAEKPSRKPKNIPPYLTTADFLEVSGVSPMSLRRYEKTGIMQPAHQAKDRAKYWTLDQVQTLMLVDELRKDGADLPDIGALAEQGVESLAHEALCSSTRGIRENRRSLKAVSHAVNSLACESADVPLDTPRLRYLPARWLALLPIDEAEPAFLASERFVGAYAKLKAVAEVVGWSITRAFGTVLSISSDGARAQRYVCAELASPPMPHITEACIVDGGCYRGAAQAIGNVFEDAKSCPADACDMCARFGRKPTSDEVDLWNAIHVEHPNRWDWSFPEGAPEVSYDFGPWSNADGEINLPHQPGRTQSAGKPVCRPRQMPTSVRLPLGVVACQIPDGLHLCMRAAYDDWAGATSGFIDKVAGMAKSNATGVDVVERLKRDSAGKTKSSPMVGPYIEPFAAVRLAGDANLFDWKRELTAADIAKLQVPINCALPPMDGYCVIAQNLPLLQGGTVIQELSVLVNAENLEL